MKNYICKDCRKKLNKSAKYFKTKRCTSCANKYYWKTHSELKLQDLFCKCRKKLNKSAHYTNSKRCSSCAHKGKLNPFAGKKHSKITLNLISKNVSKALKKVKFNKHHLDLNPNNNNTENIFILLKGHHQLFHRFAYHYLLEKFGIREILNYKKWFEKRLRLK